ncbi:TPA: small membrane protein [Klebsiella variicola subsp. variicola]|nr:small membrane protein [Klebsiella variicola subsp. variicola]
MANLAFIAVAAFLFIVAIGTFISYIKDQKKHKGTFRRWR